MNAQPHRIDVHHHIFPPGGLESYVGFDASTRRAIERDYSLALFPRLRTL